QTLVDRWPPPELGAELPLDPFFPPLPDEPLPSGADPLSSGADPSGPEPLPSEAPGSAAVVDVVALAGADPLCGAFDGSFASAGEIATRPRMPAGNGKRNFRCMGRLLALMQTLLTNDQDNPI